MSTPSIPTQIAEKRRALGISQTLLAELISVGRVNVTRWEGGTRRIPPQRELQIAATLDALALGFQFAREVAAGKAGAQNAG